MSVISFFHKHMKIIFTITISGFVAAIFAGVGGYYVSRKYDTIAKINKQKISIIEYRSHFNEVMRMVQEKNKEPLTDEDINKIEDQTLQNLLQNNLILQESSKIGIQTTDKEIRNFIATYPYFQRDGRFDPRIYFNRLRYNLRQTPEEFEKKTKDIILTNKTKMMISNAVKISEKELEYEYMRTKGSMKNYNKEKETFVHSYLSNKKILLLNTWFRNVQDKSVIQVYKKR
ncbi:SurA N-terminal domain-containing protein [bacterium]